MSQTLLNDRDYASSLFLDLSSIDYKFYEDLRLPNPPSPKTLWLFIPRLKQAVLQSLNGVIDVLPVRISLIEEFSLYILEF